MTQEIRDFVPASCELLGLGEPTHRDHAFLRVRNEIFAQLAEQGFRSIALEIDRVAALTVDDYVQGGPGDLDEVMRTGFSHGWGEHEANRELVCRLREYNRTRPSQDRVTFHGCDTPCENFSAPSPRQYLEYARDYLKLDLDVAAIAGDDHRWDRIEAVMDQTVSPGASPDARRLRELGDSLLFALYRRAPELVAATSRAEWFRAETHLTAALGLLHYHAQCAEPLPQAEREAPLAAVRDTLIAHNLLAIRRREGRRGPTLVFAHNLHLQRAATTAIWSSQGRPWSGAGAILDALGDLDYTFIAGSLGRSAAFGLGAPAPGTYESVLDGRTAAWGLTPVTALAGAHARADDLPHGHFALTPDLLARTEAVLHISDGAAVEASAVG
ncbi:erythromycin esterase family protein [Nocardia yunnanensis]|uniref:Erythromycin esterase family protein n=1 Tax=Nocardia yunnanensis TaxID=2382165 RepID=A0A386ZJX1_9NOCA|nr:erythromycin esterase family protein [Nocardia yunnanensis]AYF77660.1 erythromycin esterase family protein [Nocardia yunnanensis]